MMKHRHCGNGRGAPRIALHDDDPLVIAAQDAEVRLYVAYGLVAIRLPALGLRVRIIEMRSGPPLLIVPGNTTMPSP